MSKLAWILPWTRGYLEGLGHRFEATGTEGPAGLDISITLHEGTDARSTHVRLDPSAPSADALTQIRRAIRRLENRKSKRIRSLVDRRTGRRPDV